MLRKDICNRSMTSLARATVESLLRPFAFGSVGAVVEFGVEALQQPLDEGFRAGLRLLGAIGAASSRGRWP